MFLEAALLIEEKYDEICDELWYVYAEEGVRRERLKRSRQYSDEKIRDMMASQLRRKNSGDTVALCWITAQLPGDSSTTGTEDERV